MTPRLGPSDTLDRVIRPPLVLAIVGAAVALAACGIEQDRPVPLPPLPDVDPPVAAAPAPLTDGRVDADWLRRTSRTTSIPARVLQAYVTGASAANAAEPACRLAWNTVAAIGRVESIHGAVNGSRIGRDGVARPRILGVPLDGDGVLAITDTDGGALDGDRRWDRAVGPMQFIPTTWTRWAADGDGDGRSDPQDVDDAALAASRYLCHTGKDLQSRDGWLRAVVTYNESTPYVQKVSRTATRYAK